MNKNRLSISLVIPAYNEDNHLGACLDSVARQTIMPNEVIVVDNNSSDKTRLVAKKYPFVKLIGEKRQGVVFARNTGFNAAKSYIIGRIDADAVLPDNWAEQVIKFFNDGISTNIAWTSGAKFHNVRLSRLISAVYNILIFQSNRMLIGHYTLWGSSMAMTRSMWKTMEPSLCSRTDIHEDLDLAIHLRDSGIKIFYDRHVKVGARLRSAHSGHEEMWEYLQWWPNTLKVHRKKSWPIVWFFGALVIYCLTPYFSISDKLARLAKRSFS